MKLVWSEWASLITKFQRMKKPSREIVNRMQAESSGHIFNITDRILSSLLCAHQRHTFQQSIRFDSRPSGVHLVRTNRHKHAEPVNAQKQKKTKRQQQKMVIEIEKEIYLCDHINDHFINQINQTLSMIIYASFANRQCYSVVLFAEHNPVHWSSYNKEIFRTNKQRHSIL